jgi:MFS family permease
VVWSSLFIDFCLLTVVVAVFPSYRSMFSVSEFAIGCLFAAKPFAQVLCNPIVGVIVDRGGYAWAPFILGLVVEVLSTAIYLVRPVRYELLLAARIVQGCASACIMTTGMARVAAMYSGDASRRGTAMSLVVTGIGVGISTGPPLGGILFDLDARLPFLLLGGMAALVAAAAMLVPYLQPTEAQAKAMLLVDDERRGPQEAAMPEPVSADATSRLESSEILSGNDDSNRRRDTLCDVRPLSVLFALLIANASIALLEATVGSWLESPPNGYSTGKVGGLYAFNTVATFLSAPVAGRLGNVPWLRRYAVVLAGMILMGAGLASLHFGRSPSQGRSPAGGGPTESWPGAYAFHACSMICLGVGMGFVDGTAPALLTDVVDTLRSEERTEPRLDAEAGERVGDCNAARQSSGAEGEDGGTNYGIIFALSSAATSAGFVIGPLVGTGLSQTFGFRSVSVAGGCIVMMCAPLLLVNRRV